MIVEPLDNNITNCFIPICIENVLSEYLNYKGYEYQYAFAYSLNFKFDRNNCCEGRVADGLNNRYDFRGWLNKLYNIRIHKVEFASVEKLINYIKNSIKQQEPVIIHLDSYYLPWSTLYNKEHTTHMVIAIDVDSEKNDIKIIDTIEKEYYYDINIEILKNACKFVWDIFLPERPKTINSQQFDIQLKKGEIVLVSKERIESMKSFIEVFKNIFNSDIEFRDKYDLDLMRTEKLVDEIRKIILQINLFCNWMIWRDNNSDENKFKIVTDIYLQIMSKWNVFVNLLYKNCIIGWQKSFRTQGFKILSQIVILEECAREKFIECLNIKRHVNPNNDMLHSAKKYSNICLENYYNNKGFCYDAKQRIHEDLTGVGEYFVIKEKVAGNFDIFSYNPHNKFDNIVCEGQEILINSECETSEAYFLACSEWGAVDESLIIIGNKESQRITLHIQDLSQVSEGTPYFLGKTYNLRGDIVQESAAVFLYKIGYDKTHIIKIILPDCPTLHILEMVLSGN